MTNKEYENRLNEEADDAFCQALYKAYLEDDSPDKHETITMEALAADLGITL